MTASKKIRYIAMTTFSLLLLSACGGESSGGEDSDPTGTSVSIKRDSFGTPRIYADNTYSLFYGLGYAVAEDRLFQWEMIKRMARGTAAEVLGDSHVEADTEARTAFDSRELQSQIDALSSEDREILKGWVDGYNEHVDEVLADKDNLLSKQFVDMEIEPTPVSELDLIAAYFRGSLANFGDSNAEVLNLGLLDSLKQQHGDEAGEEIFDQLRWSNDPSAPTTVGDHENPDPEANADTATENTAGYEHRQSGAESELFTSEQDTSSKVDTDSVASGIVDAVSPDVVSQLIDEESQRYGGTGPDFYPTASNTWLLGPDRIVEDRAAFHIGPQFGNNSPTNAYGFGLHGAGYNALGSSHWGFPMVMWGANDDIGWGVTVGGGDQVDIFQLTLNPDNPMQYRHDDEWKDLETRVETIQVKDEEDVTVEILVSHYGEIDSVDEDNNTAYARARTWAGSEVDTLIAWSQMNTAQNWDEYLEYGERIGASLNWFYIDAEDNIGAAFLGDFVHRDSDFDFRLPLPGDGTADWLGPVPFEEQPSVFNPESGEIVNWNNKISRDWDNADHNYWGRAHHVDVIRNAVKEKPELTMEEFQQLNSQISLTDTNFVYFKPFLVDAVADLPESDLRKQAVNLLADWDGTFGPNEDETRYDTPAYTVFQEWLPRMVEATLQSDIPDEYLPQYSNVSPGRVTMGVIVTHNALLEDDAGVPQTYDFFNGTDKDDVISDTLQQTVDELTTEYGADLSDWLMPLTPHTFDTRALGSFDVNVPDQEKSLPINMHRGTSNHMVSFNDGELEYADVIAPGQSGHISPGGDLSPHYEDQMNIYGNFELKPGWLDESEIPEPTDVKTLDTSQ